MWTIWGAAAILTAIFNLIWNASGKDAKWFRFASLSLTALTVCAFYSMDAKWVQKEDWSALMDVVPTMSKALWTLTAASIVINGVSLFQKKER